MRQTQDLDPTPVPQLDPAALPAPLAGYRIGDLNVHLGQAAVTRNGDPIPLPRLSFDLLIALARAAPNIVTLDDLLSQVWPKAVVSPETLSQRIKLLRDALGDDPQEPRYVAGVRGRGYRLIAPVEEFRDAAPASPSKQSKLGPLPLLLVVAMAAAILAWWATSRDHAPQASTAVATLPLRSIAVLPFTDMSRSVPGNETLALGIPEAVLHQLASLDKLEVIARTSSFAFQDRAIDAREIGRQLNTRYLLEGSVQRDGDQLRVTAQLIDALNGEHVWSMRFDKPAQRVFELQDAIALEVTRALKISLDQAETDDLKSQGSAQFEAYLEFLQGRRLLATWRTDDMVSAQQHASRAIAIDPRFAAGYVLRSVAALRAAEYRAGPDREKLFREALRDSRPLLAQALTLNPKSSDAYAARGYVNAFSDLAAAELDYRKALELNPNNAEAYEGLAAVLFENPARRDEAMQLIDKARKLDPLEPRLDVAKATFLFYGRGEIAPAETLLVHALHSDPLYQPALLRLAQVYWSAGRIAEAIKLTEQVLSADAGATQARLVLQNLYLDVQDLQAAANVTRSAPVADLVLNACLSLAQRDFRAAGIQAYRAASQGKIPVVGEPLPIAAVRLGARARGDYQHAIDVFTDRSQTEWDAAGQPIIRDPSGLYLNVVGLGDMLILAGQVERGRRLLDATLVAMDRESHDFKSGEIWHQPMRPVVLALLGRHEEALLELQRYAATPAGWDSWWYYLELEPAYEPIRKRAGFQAILAVARQRAATQRQQLEKLRGIGLVPTRR